MPHPSRASLTISGVIAGVSAATSKVGNPSSTTRGARPRRASSEMAAPRDCPVSALMARATARMESSISRVVRITASQHHGLNEANLADFHLVSAGPKMVDERSAVLRSAGLDMHDDLDFVQPQPLVIAMVLDVHDIRLT